MKRLLFLAAVFFASLAHAAWPDVKLVDGTVLKNCRLVCYVPEKDEIYYVCSNEVANRSAADFPREVVAAAPVMPLPVKNPFFPETPETEIVAGPGGRAQPVHVGGYIRADGTRVRAYDRARPSK
jgi:hypothetical protein